jgi:type IV fimbrial biogenesis protein FimT
MNQVQHPRRSSRGFTMVELMIAITVVVILLVIAIPNLSMFILNSRRDSIVDGLVASLNYARTQAIDLDQPTFICAGTGGVGTVGGACASGGSWATGWQLVAIPQGATAAQVVATHSLTSSTTIPDVKAVGGNVYFQFKGNGTVSMATGSSEVITVCDSRGTSMARGVVINAAGFIQSSSTPGTTPAGLPITSC